MINAESAAWFRPQQALHSDMVTKRRTPAAKMAGVRRRVIEGEGLGGFARRLTFNVAFGALFRRQAQIFLSLA
jgi:hypothetical protein